MSIELGQSAAAEESTTESSMTCPVCGAEQVWSDACRRCKCDLSDLRRTWHLCRQARATCLRSLRAGELNRAAAAAEQFAALSPSADATRLLAVCRLLQENWREALRGAGRSRGAAISSCGTQ